jgi:hypothetical protein
MRGHRKSITVKVPRALPMPLSKRRNAGVVKQFCRFTWLTGVNQ